MNTAKFLPVITFLICLFVTFLFINLIYTPIKSEILLAQLQSRRLQAEEKKLQEFTRYHGDIENFLTLTEMRVQAAHEFLPAEMSQDSFVAEIYKVAEKNKLLVNSVQIGELETVEFKNTNNIQNPENINSDDKNSVDKKLFRQSVKVKIEGDYFSTLNFLREVLNGNRLTTLENVSLESVNNILTGDISFLIFNRASSG